MFKLNENFFYSKCFSDVFQKPSTVAQLPGVKEESPTKIPVGETIDSIRGNYIALLCSFMAVYMASFLARLYKCTGRAIALP